MWLTQLNRATTVGFEALLFLLRDLPYWLQISVVALVVAIWVLLACRVCRRRPIRAPAQVSSGNRVVGLAPYERDPGAAQHSRWQHITNTLRHFGLPMVPFLAMCIPIALLVAQVESFSRWRAIEPGEPLIISAALAAQTHTGPVISERNLELVLPVGLVLGAPPLRVDEDGTIFWRVHASVPGTFPVRIRLDGTDVQLEVIAGDTISATPAWHYRVSDWRTLAFPRAKPLPADSGFQYVVIDYPRREEGFFGICGSSWLLLGLAFIFAFVLRRTLDLGL